MPSPPPPPPIPQPPAQQPPASFGAGVRATILDSQLTSKGVGVDPCIFTPGIGTFPLSPKLDPLSFTPGVDRFALPRLHGPSPFGDEESRQGHYISSELTGELRIGCLSGTVEKPLSTQRVEEERAARAAADAARASRRSHQEARAWAILECAEERSIASGTDARQEEQSGVGSGNTGVNSHSERTWPVPQVDDATRRDSPARVLTPREKAELGQDSSAECSDEITVPNPHHLENSDAEQQSAANVIVDMDWEPLIDQKDEIDRQEPLSDLASSVAALALQDCFSSFQPAHDTPYSDIAAEERCDQD